MNHHGLNCFKPYCRLSKYLDLVNKILLSSDLLTEQKVERFQYQSRLYYQEFSQLYFRLRCFAGRARKKKNGNIIWKNNKTRIWKKIKKIWFWKYYIFTWFFIKCSKIDLKFPFVAFVKDSMDKIPNSMDRGNVLFAAYQWHLTILKRN